MPLVDQLKKLKTPEFIENNGGWLGFLIFIGVPAIIAIFGLVDPIFDLFLSLFSIDNAKHITTYWEVKYVLFLVFFFFIPIAVYLLIVRLGPGGRHRKAERAYTDITEEVRRIYAQMYGSNSPRHNLEELHLVFHIDEKYGLKCESKITLVAKDDLHFWKYFVGSEDEGDSQDFISDIGFDVDVPKRKAAFLPLKDLPHGKEIMIAFLPYVKKGQKCVVKINWQWPRCMGQLRDKGSEEYGWTCESHDQKCDGELYMEFVFDKKLGNIECRNVGSNPAGAALNSVPRPNGTTVWKFHIPKALLGKGKEYRLMFERR